MKPEARGHGLSAQPVQILSINSKLKLREFYEFVEICRTKLSGIREDLVFFKSKPHDFSGLRKASGLLGAFCLEADSWGFDDLYQIGLSLQRLLLGSRECPHDHVFWDAVSRELAMLSALLEQCESEFRRRLAAADALDALSQLSAVSTKMP